MGRSGAADECSPGCRVYPDVKQEGRGTGVGGVAGGPGGKEGEGCGEG